MTTKKQEEQQQALLDKFKEVGFNFQERQILKKLQEIVGVQIFKPTVEPWNKTGLAFLLQTRVMSKDGPETNPAPGWPELGFTILKDVVTFKGANFKDLEKIVAEKIWKVANQVSSKYKVEKISNKNVGWRLLYDNVGNMIAKDTRRGLGWTIISPTDFYPKELKKKFRSYKAVKLAPLPGTVQTYKGASQYDAGLILMVVKYNGQFYMGWSENSPGLYYRKH